MRKLGEIDKRFDKENKMRKKGLKPEALEFLNRAKEEAQAREA